MLAEWAKQWGVSDLALQDLRYRMGLEGAQAMPTPDANDCEPGSEARQQALIRIAAAQNGVWLTRNNVGALLDERGIPVRYGLANESPAQNKAVKSGDLMGCWPRLIGPHMVGQTIAQLVSVEVKKEKWVYSGKGREVQQKAWADFVTAKGGIAMFANSPESFLQQLRGQRQ